MNAYIKYECVHPLKAFTSIELDMIQQVYLLYVIEWKRNQICLWGNESHYWGNGPWEMNLNKILEEIPH